MSSSIPQHQTQSSSQWSVSKDTVLYLQSAPAKYIQPATHQSKTLTMKIQKVKRRVFNFQFCCNIPRGFELVSYRAHMMGSVPPQCSAYCPLLSPTKIYTLKANTGGNSMSSSQPLNASMPDSNKYQIEFHSEFISGSGKVGVVLT